MIVVYDMVSGQITSGTKTESNSTYSDNHLCAEVALQLEEISVEAATQTQEMPADLLTVNVNYFVDNMR